MTKTLDYYNANAEAFIEGTLNADMSKVRQTFTKYLETGAHILDAGCGSGRDSLAFKEQGYVVTAIDGSKEICKKAAALLGQPVRTRTFKEIEDVNTYDDIWACATLLHVPSSEMVEVFRHLVAALKEDGVLYVSFKYGVFEGERNGRYFNDYNEEKFKEVLQHFPELCMLEKWTTDDVRVDRTEQWLNMIFKKKY